MKIVKGLIVAAVGFIVCLIILAVVCLTSWGSVHDNCVNKSGAVDQSLSQVQNQYQRRFDLIPNIVATVKGYSDHERDTFVKVAEARTQVANLMVDKDKLASDPEVQKQYMQAQQGLTAALSGLKITLEKYPELKADAGYLKLQDELAGTENRIAVERMNYGAAVKDYNNYIQGFFTGFVARYYNFAPRPYFKADDAAQKAPTVKF